jgi:hypothetical protein
LKTYKYKELQLFFGSISGNVVGIQQNPEYELGILHDSKIPHMKEEGDKLEKH